MSRTNFDKIGIKALGLNGVDVASTAAQLNKVAAVAAGAQHVVVEEALFTEAGAGTYTAAITKPAGATLLDIIVNAVALWAAATSAVMNVGDAGAAAGYFSGVDLKATDLLAGESISFAQAGGKAGAYIANSQVSPRYTAVAQVISGVVTSVGAGTTGRTRMLVVYAMPNASPLAAIKT